jgi:hypothetical protein
VPPANSPAVDTSRVPRDERTERPDRSRGMAMRRSFASVMTELGNRS